MDNNKLYSYTGSIDYKYCGKLATIFPQLYNKYLIILGTVINLLFTSICFNIEKEFFLLTICFVVIEILLLVFIRLKTGFIVKIIYKIISKDKPEEYFVEFYKDYLIYKIYDKTVKEKYENIDKCIETSNDFFLCDTVKRKICTIEKEHCSLELVDFLKRTFHCETNNKKNKLRFRVYNNRNFGIEKLYIIFALNIVSYFVIIYLENLFLVLFENKFEFISFIYLFFSIIFLIIGFKYKKKYSDHKKQIELMLFIVFLLTVKIIFPFINSLN